MVKRKHPGFIGGGQLLIDTNFIEPEELSEDFSVDDDCASLYEYYGSGSVEVVARKYVYAKKLFGVVT